MFVKRFFMFSYCLLAVFLAVSAKGSASGANKLDGRMERDNEDNYVNWREVVTSDEQRIGFGHTEVTQGEGVRKVFDSLTITTRQSNMAKVKVHLSTEYVETREGKPLSVVELSEVGKLVTKRVAHIDLPTVNVVLSKLKKQQRFSISVPENTRFDEGDGILKQWDFTTDPILRFMHFNLSSQKVEEIVVELDSKHEPLADGSFWVIRKVFSTPEAKLRQKTRVRLDKYHQVVEKIADIAGNPITIRNTDRETALSGIRSYNVIRDHSIKSPYSISKKALNGHIRYTFSHIEGKPLIFPDTGEQRVTDKGNQVVLDVCDTCGLEVEEVDLEAYLKPTAWLQSDAQEIRSLVSGIAAKKISDVKKMKAFAKIVNKTLPDVEFVGHATALESLSTRRGDCTEFAVLYAALARAAGIPARVVSGLAYSKESFHGVSNVFIPHAWVQAWIDGRWQSFDASLGAFDSSHIALSISDGEPEAFIEASQLASKLKWESVARVKSKKK